MPNDIVQESKMTHKSQSTHHNLSFKDRSVSQIVTQ